MSYVVGVAGPIGAGKSVLADELACVYGGRRRSFGGVVRRRAAAIGRSLDRDSLQKLGDEIIATEGWEAFCGEVLGDTSEEVVIVVDGIRHVGAIDALTAIVGVSRFRLVFVDAPRDKRIARVITRDGVTEAEFDAAESHPNERELPLVRERADVATYNDDNDADPLQTMARAVVSRLDADGFQPTSF